jgi:hypothetical protein
VRSKIAHETTDALPLSGHARTPSGCKSRDIKRTVINKSTAFFIACETASGAQMDWRYAKATFQIEKNLRWL